MFKLRYFLVLMFAIFCAYKIFCSYSYTNLSLIEQSQQCLRKKLNYISPRNFDREWLKLNKTVNKCTKNLLQDLQIKEFPNSDEIKIGILPKNLNADCNVLTLGIGKDVKAENELLQTLPQCKFLGVDPDPKESGKLFLEVTKGKYIEGVVGITAGFYNSTILKENGYKSEILPHYSLRELLAKNYQNSQIIDYIFMDIEGDEFELMQDLISNYNEYPIICQINVEFHDPHKNERGKRFFQTLLKSVKDKIYLPLKVERELIYSFNRVFFMNLNEKCLNKFYH